jgi:hypothetical protein
MVKPADTCSNEYKILTLKTCSNNGLVWYYTFPSLECTINGEAEKKIFCIIVE